MTVLFDALEQLILEEEDAGVSPKSGTGGCSVSMAGVGTGEEEAGIRYEQYHDETQLPDIMALIDQELSEPYSIFTYRYFITLWPHLCFMAFDGDKCVGTIVCKMGQHRSTFRGYIAMLVVIKPYRGKGIATELVTRCIQVMREAGCDEVTLEAEVTNDGALALYGNLGFIRAKRLHRYYLNGVDAYRLKLLFPRPQDPNAMVMLDELKDDHEDHHDCSQHDHHHHHHHPHHQHSGCSGHQHDHSGCGHQGLHYHHHDHGHFNREQQEATSGSRMSTLPSQIGTVTSREAYEMLRSKWR